MQALGALADAGHLRPAIAPLLTQYHAWLDAQAQTPLDSESRRDTAETLIEAGRRAAARIEVGVQVLERHPLAFDAFRSANQVMATAGQHRRKDEPRWRAFQLAFLLMNVAALVEPGHGDRDIVDLIFFPTGGGKTEAYLGLPAFTLILRRLRHPGLTSAGVTILMRYTLRLLTLDQLERAATLICALELLRRADLGKYGPQRFSIGLWVGKAATPTPPTRPITAPERK